MTENASPDPAETFEAQAGAQPVDEPDVEDQGSRWGCRQAPREGAVDEDVQSHGLRYKGKLMGNKRRRFSLPLGVFAAAVGLCPSRMASRPTEVARKFVLKPSDITRTLLPAIPRTTNLAACGGSTRSDTARGDQMNKPARALAASIPLLVLMLGLLTPATAAADDVATNARVEKAVVFLDIHLEGYVRYPLQAGGEAYFPTDKPIVIDTFCSSFLITPSGDAVTAAHCVDRNGFKEDFLKEALPRMQEAGIINQSPEEVLPYAMQEWGVEGVQKGSPPSISVRASQPRVVKGPVELDAVPTDVVTFREYTDGDVALLKIPGVSGAEALSVAAADPAPGQKLTAVGFPANVRSTVDSVQRASFKSGTASSQQTSPEGIPFTEINADVSGGMSGGPTIDEYGNVLGVNSRGFRDQAFNFITDTTDLGAFLRQNGITTAQPSGPAEVTSAPVVTPPPAAEVDSGVHWGVWVGAGGVVVLLAAAAIVAVILARRGRSGGAAPAGSNAPWPTHGSAGGTSQAPPCDHAGNPPGAQYCFRCGARVS